MAAITDNEKGFKVIELTAVELTKIGGYGICDCCNAKASAGFLICVLNQWYCPKCYPEYLKRARRYEEDKPKEDERFNYYRHIFQV